MRLPVELREKDELGLPVVCGLSDEGLGPSLILVGIFRGTVELDQRHPSLIPHPSRRREGSRPTSRGWRGRSEDGCSRGSGLGPQQLAQRRPLHCNEIKNYPNSNGF